MLVAICGNLGSGKTLSLTFMGWWFLKKGYDIYSNYKLNFPHKRLTSFKDLSNFNNGVFLGDELWSWTDSREFGSRKNKDINAILLKSRKRGIDIFYTTQHFKQMDVRIRRITDIIVLPEMFKRGRLCRLYFFDNSGYKVRRPIVFKTEDIFPLYDTTEEVEDIQGFEGLKAIQLRREQNAIKKLKEENKDPPEKLYKQSFDRKRLKRRQVHPRSLPALPA